MPDEITGDDRRRLRRILDEHLEGLWSSEDMETIEKSIGHALTCREDNRPRGAVRTAARMLGLLVAASILWVLTYREPAE